MLYNVTVTRTGSVVIEANNANEAFDIVNSLKCSEIDEQGDFEGWKPSDIELLSESIILKGQRLIENEDLLTLELYDIEGVCYDRMRLRVINNKCDLNEINYSIYQHFKNVGYDNLYYVPTYEVEDFLIDEFHFIENKNRK